MNPIIFLRTAWMINYEGVTKTDKPDGAGSFVKENQTGGEVCNFLNIHSKYYGFARVRKGNDLRIVRLGADKNAEFIDNVTVVFFATNPLAGGQFVVGWYENAKLYRTVQDLPSNQRKGHPFYLTVTSKNKGTLLSIKQRNFEIPKDGPGQTNVWYVMEYKNSISYLKSFFAFKANPEKHKEKKSLPRNSKGHLQGWMLDAEKRKKIEIAAMDATKDYFEAKGFLIKYVHNEMLGWDMEAIKGAKKLLLEVKGTINPIASITLTPNEYKHSKIKPNFRICIFENALNKTKSTLHICRIDYRGKFWISDCGDQFNIKEIKSAQLTRVSEL